MNRYLLCVLIFSVPAAAQADGWGDLKGKNRVGDLVMPIPSDQDFPYDDNKYKQRGPESWNIHVFRGGTISEEAERVFKYEACSFELAPNTFERAKFSCSVNGSSPLAGVTYRIAPNGDPDDCSYEFRYICIDGCDREDAPLEMRKSYWECEQQ